MGKINFLKDKLVSKDAKIAVMQRVLWKLGFTTFNKGYFNVNIVGIRTNDVTTNVFNDYMVVWYWAMMNSKVLPQFFIWPITTDPGLYYLNNPSNVYGTAILKEGQYKNTFAIDYHGGKYLALCQRLAPVTVYRDRNKDNVLDFKNEQTGFFGINIHRASYASIVGMVGKFSAGCQVFQNPADFKDFMTIIQSAEGLWKNEFTYTLITENQFDKHNGIEEKN